MQSGREIGKRIAFHASFLNHALSRRRIVIIDMHATTKPNLTAMRRDGVNP
jgi:hypothetical protein